jgi:hypothetical protein
MKIMPLLIAVMLHFGGGAAFAQPNGSNVQVQPGYFCAQNKCVRFSRDLQSVSIQSRRSVSVASYGLQENPVISSETFRKIFYLALRQSGVGPDR